MPWLILFFAGLLEIAWAIGLKWSEGFTRIGPTIFTAVTLAMSMILLGWAMRSLPVGTAYAVWTGIGSVGTVILGIVIFGDSAHPARLLCIALIVMGILGLKFLVPAE